jgi:hypothetical protein
VSRRKAHSVPGLGGALTVAARSALSASEAEAEIAGMERRETRRVRVVSRTSASSSWAARRGCQEPDGSQTNAVLTSSSSFPSPARQHREVHGTASRRGERELQVSAGVHGPRRRSVLRRRDGLASRPDGARPCPRFRRGVFSPSLEDYDA